MNAPLTHDDYARIVTLLTKAEKSDLGIWDRDFVEDMLSRLKMFGTTTLISASQHKQIDRIGDAL